MKRNLFIFNTKSTSRGLLNFYTLQQSVVTSIDKIFSYKLVIVEIESKEVGSLDIEFIIGFLEYVHPFIILERLTL